MDDFLKKLGEKMPPQPDAERKAEVLRVSRAAFDDAEKKSNATQGSRSAGRLRDMFKRFWSVPMNKSYLAGTALALIVAIPAATYLTVEMGGELPVPVSVPPAIEKEKPAQDLSATAPIESEVLNDGLAQRQNDASLPEAEVSGLMSQEESAAAPVVARARKQMGGTGETLSIMPGREAPVLLEPENRDRFVDGGINGLKVVAQEPVSTFSIDVDTASYSFMRRSLMEGRLPPSESVRVEELINYFHYDWPKPSSIEEPFRPTVTVMPTPWNSGTELMHVAINSYQLEQTERPNANLVFLIDVSGSMNARDKLPLLKNAFRLLVDRLQPSDTVSIVTYAGNSGVVLEPTKVENKADIFNAIDGLMPGGSTAGAAGLEAAYQLAQKAFVKDGVNRVMLATDGDFNVGPSSDDALKAMIEQKRDSGIFLSVLGFGRGNYNDGLMQAIAQNGNGTAAYIDTLAEAQKTLVEEAGSSLFPVAKDVKIQVEFNPEKIAEYRLIGYETRALNREDFNNDKVDAGEIGSGHQVTAIYEITPKGSPAVMVDDLRYGGSSDAETAAETTSDELAFVKMRFKKPDGDKSELISVPVGASEAKGDFAEVSRDVRFSVAVAAFGQKLKGVDALQDYSYDAIDTLAQGARGDDPFGYRAEFIRLVKLAEGIDPASKR